MGKTQSIEFQDISPPERCRELVNNIKRLYGIYVPPTQEELERAPKVLVDVDLSPFEMLIAEYYYEKT